MALKPRENPEKRDHHISPWEFRNPTHGCTPPRCAEQGVNFVEEFPRSGLGGFRSVLNPRDQEVNLDIWSDIDRHYCVYVHRIRIYLYAIIILTIINIWLSLTIWVLSQKLANLSIQMCPKFRLVRYDSILPRICLHVLHCGILL